MTEQHAFRSRGSSQSSREVGDQPPQIDLERKLARLAARAVTELDMVEDGDRILVAVSGGKDSYVMLRLLLRMQRVAPIKFDLVAFHLDQAHPAFPWSESRLRSPPPVPRRSSFVRTRTRSSRPS